MRETKSQTAFKDVERREKEAHIHLLQAQTALLLAQAAEIRSKLKHPAHAAEYAAESARISNEVAEKIADTLEGIHRRLQEIRDNQPVR